MIIPFWSSNIKRISMKNLHCFFFSKYLLCTNGLQIPVGWKTPSIYGISRSPCRPTLPCFCGWPWPSVSSASISGGLGSQVWATTPCWKWHLLYLWDSVQCEWMWVLSPWSHGWVRAQIQSNVSCWWCGPQAISSSCLQTSDSLEMKWVYSWAPGLGTEKKESVSTGGISAHSMEAPGDWEPRESASERPLSLWRMLDGSGGWLALNDSGIDEHHVCAGWVSFSWLGFIVMII